MVIPIVRPPPEVVAARKRAIARRYAELKRKKLGPLSMAAIRASELTRLYQDIWPTKQLPDDDQGEMAARVMANHLAKLRDAPRRIDRWLDRWMTGLSLVSHERLINDVLECPLRYSADKLAWKFKVTAEQRTRLRLRTIGAIDQTRAERAAAAQIRKLERQRARRRANGAKPRAEYEATARERTRPWETEGISRRTWYRRQRGTTTSAI